MFTNLVLIFVTTIALPDSAAPFSTSQSEDIIQINNMHTSWEAGPTPEDTIEEILQSLRGRVDTTKIEELSTLNHRSALFPDLPDSFDARENWPHCKDIIGTITRQGDCSSCWAHSSARAISDRICIESKGTTKVNISVEDLVTCCKTCSPTNGCEGGILGMAYKYWIDEGIVSGGADVENTGCKPMRSIFTKVAPECQKICTNSKYEKDYDQDKHYGQLYYRVKQKDVLQIQIEIMTHGPVSAIMEVMQDLVFYKQGVYRYSKGNYTNLHGVRILGWGVENDTSYWLVANSWGTEFGKLGGFLKIVKGENHMKIENWIVGGRVNATLGPREFLTPGRSNGGVEEVSNLLQLNFVVLTLIAFSI
ncbi:unnamed protein product [Tenebrio molitor]|nr:unnamed protein product [Tenebrio molitor]